MSFGQELTGAVLRIVMFLAVGSVLLLWALASVIGLAVDSNTLRGLGDGTVGVGVRLILFGFAIYLSATLARFVAGRSRAAFVLVNTGLLLGVLVLFGLGLLGVYIRPLWLALAALFIVAVQAGAWAFAAYRARTLRRLFGTPGSMNDATRQAIASLEAHFDAHSRVYVALPAGAAIGAFAGILLQWPPEQVVRMSIVAILALLAAGVGIFLVRGAWILATSHLREAAGARATLMLPRNATVPVALVPPLRVEAPDSIRAQMDGIVMAADVRRLFLVNQYQQVAVLVASGSAAGALFSGAIDLRLGAAGALVAGLLLTQVPYVIGQWRAHAHLLDRLVGARREETREQLTKLAPMAPTLDSWVAFTLSGAFGGIAGKLLERTVLELLRW